MTNIILILAGVLVFIILFLLFRMQSLVTIVKGSDRIGASNKVNASLMLVVPIVLLILGVWSFIISKPYFLPAPVSEHGQATDSLFWVTLAIITLMFLITNAALFLFAYKYQYKEDRQASFFHDSPQLELFWTIVPAVIMALLVFFGWKIWAKTMGPIPEGTKPVVVEIMGKQFGWQTRYPGKDGKLGSYDFRLINDAKGNEMGIDFEDNNSKDDFIPKEMHVPVNKSVLLKIRSRDVIHSVFAPHFRLKMDAVPGMMTQFHFIPTKTTEQMRNELGNSEFDYEIACTEVCGLGHSGMRYVIVVEEEDEYEKWLKEQKPLLELKPDLKGIGMSSLKKKKTKKKEHGKSEH